MPAQIFHVVDNDFGRFLFHSCNGPSTRVCTSWSLTLNALPFCYCRCTAGNFVVPRLSPPCSEGDLHLAATAFLHTSSHVKDPPTHTPKLASTVYPISPTSTSHPAQRAPVLDHDAAPASVKRCPGAWTPFLDPPSHIRSASQ